MGAEEGDGGTMNGNKITADSSFLINFYLLGWLDILCKVYDEIYITPTVRSECVKIKKAMDSLHCVIYIELSEEEDNMVAAMLETIKHKFPGEHRGESEALAVAHCRNIPLLISDNFAPWYLRSNNKEISVEIERGYYVLVKAIELGALKPIDNKELGVILNKIKGVYPTKAIGAIRKKFSR